MSVRPKARFATLMAFTALVVAGVSISQVFDVKSNYDGSWGSLADTELKSNVDRIAELERQIADLQMRVGVQVSTDGAEIRPAFASEEPALEPATLKYIGEIESLLEKIKQDRSNRNTEVTPPAESDG